MNQPELATLLGKLGCPPDKSAEMAAQLDKRAKQLAEKKGRSYDEALSHLLGLMQQGWAAKEKGLWVEGRETRVESRNRRDDV